MPGQQAVVLGWATRGCAEHTLGGACQNLRETTPRGLKKPWILEAPGSLPPKVLEIPTSVLRLCSSRTCFNISDWKFTLLDSNLALWGHAKHTVLSNTHSLIHLTIHSFIRCMLRAYPRPGLELCAGGGEGRFQRGAMSFPAP